MVLPLNPHLGYTLILRVALWVPITVLGAIYFVREGLKWNLDVKELRDEAEAIPGDEKEVPTEDMQDGE